MPSARLPGAWCANTRECLDTLLRPGNAGSNTFTDHKEVLAAALKQVPARFRRQLIVRVDGAGASHDLIAHLLSLSSPRKKVLFTSGWTSMAADEGAIRQVPAAAWQPGITQDGEEAGPGGAVGGDVRGEDPPAIDLPVLRGLRRHEN